MRLFKTKDRIYIQNLIEVNILIERILFATIFMPPLLMILKQLEIYSNISELFLVHLFVMSVVMTLGSVILNRAKDVKIKRLSVYFELICISLYIGVLGSTGDIEIYISYALIPLISCLYYSVKTTNIVSFFGYIIMLIALYTRSKNEYFFSLFSGRYQTPLEWCFESAIGLSIEYFISYLISVLIAHKFKSYYDKLIVAQKGKDQVYNELKENSAKIFEANDVLVNHTYQLYDIQDKIIQFIGEVLGSHDLFTGNHIIHTRVYIGMIARDMRENGFYTDELTDEKIRLLEMAALLHDVGKVHIPEGVLNSTDKFTVEEFELMKSHTTEGKKLLEFLPQIEEGRFNKIAIDMAYYHHEKWDGTGYPTNKVGTEIPLSARIMAAADVLDALISQRLYKSPMTVDEALKIFEEGKNSHFESCIAESVIRCRDQIVEIDQRFKIEEAEKNERELEWWVSYHEKLKNLGIN